MTAWYLALYNFSMFRERSEHPANRGFHERNDLNFLLAERSEGFVARSGHPDEPGPESWGEQVFPRFYVDNGDGWAPSTLSLRTDLVSPMAFSYGGFHAETMRHAREWFAGRDWPPYVLWWVEAGRRPLWRDGVERLEHLHDHGPSPFAFDFRTPFDGEGRPVAIDRAAVKRAILLNETRHREGRALSS